MLSITYAIIYICLQLVLFELAPLRNGNTRYNLPIPGHAAASRLPCYIIILSNKIRVAENGRVIKPTPITICL